MKKALEYISNLEGITAFLIGVSSWQAAFLAFLVYTIGLTSLKQIAFYSVLFLVFDLYTIYWNINYFSKNKGY